MAPPPKKAKHHTFQEVEKLNLSTHGQYKNGAREKPKSIRLTRPHRRQTSHKLQDEVATKYAVKMMTTSVLRTAKICDLDPIPPNKEQCCQRREQFLSCQGSRASTERRAGISKEENVKPQGTWPEKAKTHTYAGLGLILDHQTHFKIRAPSL
jgi:hypothetical protein